MHLPDPVYKPISGAQQLLDTKIAQLILVAVSFGLSAWLVYSGQEVPEWLIGTIGIIVGYYFGSTTRAAR